MSAPELRVLDDPAAVAGGLLAEATGQVALTGGSTPRAAYERAARLRGDWSGVELWFTDERCVPPDHEHSNFAMASRALGREALGEERSPRAGRASAGPSMHRMRGELGPDEGAADYERELAAALGEGIPVLDLILLGLGPDAHTCSLFPGDAALEQRERPVAGVEVPGMAPLVPRITLTLPVLNAAREIVFLAMGEDKAAAVERALDAPDPSAPASLVQPEEGSVTWLLDRAAGART